MRLIISILALLICGSAANAQVAVIVNKSVPVAQAEGSFIKNCYKLVKQTWDDGSKIVVFAAKKKSKTSDQFYNFIGTKRSKMKKLWLKKQLTGEGKAPKALANDSQIVDKVSKTPGAIGFVDKSAVTADVKVIYEITQ